MSAPSPDDRGPDAVVDVDRREPVPRPRRGWPGWRFSLRYSVRSSRGLLRKHCGRSSEGSRGGRPHASTPAHHKACRTPPCRTQLPVRTHHHGTCSRLGMLSQVSKARPDSPVIRGVYSPRQPGCACRPRGRGAHHGPPGKPSARPAQRPDQPRPCTAGPNIQRGSGIPSPTFKVGNASRHQRESFCVKLGGCLVRRLALHS